MDHCILLGISSVFSKSLMFGILVIIFAHFGIFEFFRVLFLHGLRYQFETCHIYLLRSATRLDRISSHSGHVDLLYSQNRFFRFIVTGKYAADNQFNPLYCLCIHVNFIVIQCQVLPFWRRIPQRRNQGSTKSFLPGKIRVGRRVINKHASKQSETNPLYVLHDRMYGTLTAADIKQTTLIIIRWSDYSQKL